MTTIVLYSVQPMLSAGLEVTLAASEGFRLAAACTDLSQLADQIHRTAATLVLIELTPDVTLQALKEIQAMSRGVPSILWVDHVSTEFASQVIAAGVRGILRKTMSLDQHLDCFRKVALGELELEKGLSDQLLSSQRVTLTPRERQVMGLVAQGLRNKEIAYSIGVTEGTIKVYLSRLFQKVGANDRLDLALFALRNMAASGTFETVSRRQADQPRPSPKPLFVTGFVSRPVERRLQ
ncbi:MAG: LuxR C-terminal-related transcriptional regulator [Bryobacteraceae bacterium]